jgi:hypothetical protein
LILASLLPLVVPGMAEAQPESAAGLFPRGVYWPQERVAWLAERKGLDVWEYADELLASLHADHHCNLIWVVNIGTDGLQRLCAIAAKHDVQVVGTVEPVLWWRQHRTPEFARQCAEETAKRLADTEGLYGYVSIDEPRVWELSYLDAIRRELALLDPTRPSLTVTMRGDTPAAIQRTGFPIITSDIYPFFFEGDPNGPNPAPVSRAYYRLCTEGFGEQCAGVGKTFWLMPQAFMEAWGDWYYDERMNVVAQEGAYLHWRMPTVGETRWQIWQGLAGGARGIIFFVLFPPKNERTADSEPGPGREHTYPRIAEPLDTGQPAALLNPDSTPTAQMVAMGKTFAEIEALEPILRRLRSADFPAVFVEPPLHCQTLRDEQGNLCTVVVNDDTDNASTGDLQVLPGIDRVRDLKKGDAFPLGDDEGTGLRIATLTLGPGEGTLLELAAEPARRPLPTAIEDFETPLVTGSLQDAQVQVSRLPWGVGWRYELVQTAEGDNAPPAVLTCPVAMLTGDPKAHRPSGPIYIVYSGRGKADVECVELSFSTDGETFERASVDEFDRPIVLPREATHVRFVVNNGAAVSGFRVIATEARQDAPG